MIELIKSVYRTLKPWKIPTKPDGLTIEPAYLARLIGRKS